MDGLIKIAKILRVDHKILETEIDKLEKVTGKNGVLENIYDKNIELLSQKLEELDVNFDSLAKEVYDALISKLEADDLKLFEALGRPNYNTQEGSTKVTQFVNQAFGNPPGFFLKLEKAKEFLIRQPPQNVLKFLGYTSVEEMLLKEDIYEVYASLRFIEGSEWLNNVFFKQYEKLSPSDFEKRPLILRALNQKWIATEDGFIKKKYHNLSHLKELGFIFVIPIPLNVSGETMRTFSLLLHYFNEIQFYSSLFEKYALSPINFANNLISLLRGDVLEEPLPPSQRPKWFIIQRYLAKDDPNDWRLFTPHVNPEAIHWLKAQEGIQLAGKKLGIDFSFWDGLDWVGDYFKDDTGISALVSLNIIDTAMSLVKEKELVKYLYHQEEALWNEIFFEFIGRERAEELIKQNILKGYIEL